MSSNQVRFVLDNFIALKIELRPTQDKIGTEPIPHSDPACLESPPDFVSSGPSLLSKVTKL